MLPEQDGYLLLDYNHHSTFQYGDYQKELVNIISNYASSQQISMVGYSMGGRLLFSTMPFIYKTITNATFISSGLPLKHPLDQQKKQAFDALILDQCKKLNAHEFVHWWYTLNIYKGLHQHPKFDTYCNNISSTIHYQRMKQLINSLSSTQMPLTSYYLPIHVNYIYGEFDQKYKNIAAQYPLFFKKVRLFTIPNASHLCWFEAPEKLKKIMKDLT